MSQDLSAPEAPTPIPPGNFRPSPRMWRWSLILFLLTCGSTLFIGMANSLTDDSLRHLIEGGPESGVVVRGLLWSGFQYSAAVMGILLLHELGHYVQARRYHVPAIPPMFIPMPIGLFGTMGAVIVQAPGHADRKAMFDIAISGPLAGLCLALPIAWFGALHSETAIVSRPTDIFGDPLILKWMYEAVHGALGPNEIVVGGPLLMAGWVGIFITALNLAPVGQLDGGHILYCLIGRRSHIVALLFVAFVVGYMVLTAYWTFAPMIVLLFLMGLKHPPTANDAVPLGWGRMTLGWLTLAFLFIGISPRPLDTIGPTATPVEHKASNSESSSGAARPE